MKPINWLIPFRFRINPANEETVGPALPINLSVVIILIWVIISAMAVIAIACLLQNYVFCAILVTLAVIQYLAHAGENYETR